MRNAPGRDAVHKRTQDTKIDVTVHGDIDRTIRVTIGTRAYGSPEVRTNSRPPYGIWPNGW